MTNGKGESENSIHFSGKESLRRREIEWQEAESRKDKRQQRKKSFDSSGACDACCIPVDVRGSLFANDWALGKKGNSIHQVVKKVQEGIKLIWRCKWGYKFFMEKNKENVFSQLEN